MLSQIYSLEFSNFIFFRLTYQTLYYIMFSNTVQMYMYNQEQKVSHVSEMQGEFVCIICDKSLSSKLYLDNHTRYMHSTVIKEPWYMDIWYTWYPDTWILDILDILIHGYTRYTETWIYLVPWYMDILGTLIHEYTWYPDTWIYLHPDTWIYLVPWFRNILGTLIN